MAPPRFGIQRANQCRSDFVQAYLSSENLGLDLFVNLQFLELRRHHADR